MVSLILMCHAQVGCNWGNIKIELINGKKKKKKKEIMISEVVKKKGKY